ncbi:protein PHYLLO, chloroplastic [Hevea brasiliensis]|uniref:protein PHYLLO, chloroplastic n=1 Tax=Hevea brasiliensis TaxID=3981 RepID=UPI0025DBC9D5|nr:protein PHYLLO, chloroplastic [Hevea brasiliensis]
MRRLKIHHDNVVLFLHGFLETGEDWMSIMKAISGSARCISIDLPGQGGSKMQNCEAKQEATLSVEIVAHKFYKVIQGITPRKIVVVGYSMGAMIVSWTALRHVDKINAVIHRKTLIPFVQSPQLIFLSPPTLTRA